MSKAAYAAPHASENCVCFAHSLDLMLCFQCYHLSSACMLMRPPRLPLCLQAYKALVKGARSEKLEEVLAQTEACFATFAAKLGLAAPHTHRQQPLGRSSGGDCGSEGPGPNSMTSGAASSSPCPWAALAERVLAVVPEQPAMLHGPGPLRDYQMHVSLDVWMEV